MAYFAVRVPSAVVCLFTAVVLALLWLVMRVRGRRRQ